MQSEIAAVHSGVTAGMEALQSQLAAALKQQQPQQRS
jgi:hypothetical protein